MAATAEAVHVEAPRPTEPIVADPERVRAHVSHILASPDFAAAPQLAAFLRYIVEKKLSGEEEIIKAYTIATEALGRSTDFDAQNDPIVRVQARRLRQALLLYYANGNADQSIRIILPVGGYVPEFSIPEREAEVTPPAAPALAATPAQRPLFETKWIAPVALVLSTLSMILSLWPQVIRYILGP